MMASSARIEELEKKFNENPRRYFAPLANEYRKAGDVQQAIAICRTYVPQQPGHMSGHIVFGQALFEAGDHDEARGVFEAALGLDPENLIALRHLGDIAREHGETDDARAWYRRVLDADPRNDDVAALLMSLEAEPAPASEEPATWMEINPEQTLELPPDILAAVPREMGFASGPPRTPATPAGSMGELFGAGAVDVAPSPDPIGAATLEFRSSSPYAGVADGVDEAAKTVPAFVTETMAELYLQQGFRDEALGVYKQLLAQNPHDDSLRERVEQLESGSRSSMSMASVSETVIDAAQERRTAPAVRSVRSFFGGLAARRVASHATAAEVEVTPSPVAEHEPEPEPEREPEPVAQAEPAHESVHEPAHEAEPQPEAPPPLPPTAAQDHDGYSDQAFSEEAFGANAFTGGYSPQRKSAGILAHEDFSSESLVSRVTEEVDVFGLPLRTEQSEPEPEAPRAEHVPAEAPPVPPLNGLFAGSDVAPKDEAAASTLAGAFGGQQPGESERTVRPASNELSLDTVFRESSTGDANPTRRESSAFSFDQFFGSDTSNDNVSPIEGAVGNDADSSGVETEQFSSWLSGLKKK
jgi:tetratricopeptide (TPR) repeat protein